MPDAYLWLGPPYKLFLYFIKIILSLSLISKAASI